MTEIKSGFPSANSVSFSSTKQPNDSAEARGHLQTAHGEMTVVQVKATQMAVKPQQHHNELAGSAVTQRIVTQAEVSSAEQTAQDLETIKKAGEFFDAFMKNPQGAAAALAEELKEKGN